MKINGRLLLLAVALAMFVRVWKMNEHPRLRTGVRPRACASGTLLSHATEPPGFKTRVAQVANRRRSAEELCAGESWTTGDCPIPLPAGIPAGVYRVVSDAGRVATLTVVPKAAAAVLPQSAPSELLTTVAGSERWYWIRLRSSQGPSEASAALRVDAPAAVGRRKFDFSDYVAPEFMAPESSLIEASRPAPPELPTPL